MKLHEIKVPKGAKKRRKRVGRGIGSGHGKTSCRGTKGQKAKEQIRLGFEGGQTPLYRRLPKRKGFTNIFSREYAIVNLGQLNRFDKNALVSPEILIEKGIVRKLRVGVKILGEGSLKKPLIVRAHAFSKKAKETIEAAGGKAEVI